MGGGDSHDRRKRRRLLEDTEKSAVSSPSSAMEKIKEEPISQKDRKLLWFAILFALGLAVIITLIATESLPAYRIYGLVTVGILAFSASVFVMGWHRGSSTWKTARKSVGLFLIISGGLSWLGWNARPKAPILEISKETGLASIDIAPGTEAQIIMLKDDFKVDRELCQNDGKNFINWIKSIPNGFPERIFTYHIYNHNPYSITNLRAILKARFLDKTQLSKVVASRDIEIDEHVIPIGGSYSFYIVNESHHSVLVDSPINIRVQKPGEEKEEIPIIKGPLIMGKSAISDIIAVKPGAPSIPLDLPLSATNRNWDNTGCSE